MARRTQLTETAEVVQSNEVETRLLSSSVKRVQLQRLAMRGLSAKQSAKLLGISHATAQAHYRDPDFRRAVLNKVDLAFIDSDAAFVERTKTLAERLEEQAMKSFEELQEMLKPDGEFGEIPIHIRHKINEGFLDRHASTATVQKNHLTMDPVMLKRAAIAANEMDTAQPTRTISKVA